MLLLGRLAGYAALKSVDEIKAALLAGYALPTTHPTAAASLLSLLPEDGCAVGLLPTEVTIQVYVDRLHALDPVAQSYGLDGYLRAWWRDPRLRFNASEAASCGATPTLSLTRTESLAIWRPDLYWEKALTVVLPEPQMGFTTGAGELLSVGPEGDVFWSRQARFTLACPMSLARLPFDTQRCSFIAGLYSQTAERVSLAWRDGAEALAGWRAAACVTGWVMSGLEQVSELQSYVSGNYTYARATLSFTRAPNRFVQQYMVQSIIMVIISWLGFLIDPTATPARVALGIITVMVVLQNYIALSNSLPSDIHGTWLGMFTLVSFLFNILAFVEQALRHSRDALLDLFHEWDTDGDGQIAKKEFRRGVAALVPAAPPAEVNALFDAYDKDQSDTLTLDELQQLLNDFDNVSTGGSLSSSSHGPVSVSSSAPADEGDDPGCNTDRPRGGGGGMTARATSAAVAVILEQEEDHEGGEGGGGSGTLHVVNAKLKAGSHAGSAAQRSPKENRRNTLHQLAMQAQPQQRQLEAAEEATGSNTTQARTRRTAGMDASTYSGRLGGRGGLQRPSSYFGSCSSLRASRVFASRESSRKRKTRQVRRAVIKSSQELLGTGAIWLAKTHFIFPCLVALRHLDHISRFLFPASYLLFVLAHFSTVNFGNDQWDVLNQVECYREG